MSEILWVVGGEQKDSLEPEEWHRFRAGVVARVEPETGRVERVLEYRSPPEHCPDDRPSHLFKAATLEERPEGDTIWLCTQTEVLECGFPGFEIRRVISLPCFNDLHHVTPGPNGNLFVAVTGLDAVAEITREGELVRLDDVLGGDVWSRFDPGVDYRKVLTTKPHRSHPNHVFFLDGQPWVTRFEQRDAVPVDPSRNGHRGPFSVAVQGIHDGHVDGGRLVFTSVDGRVVTFDTETGERRELDLNSLKEPGDERPLGWCRGLLTGDGDGGARRAWVGFSRLRQTKLRQNLSWIRNGFRERLPTRVALYDLERPALLREITLDRVGLNAVFSIHGALV